MNDTANMASSPASFLRIAPAAFVAAVTLGAASSALAGGQYAFQDRDVSRVISIGGACERCELSGRRLTGANFIGANFSQATLVGSDLRGTTITGCPTRT